MEQCLTPSEIKKLSVAERILIVEEIWETLPYTPTFLTLNDNQKNIGGKNGTL
jgi:putative addiction module component (TIGR02574 family)